MDHPPSDSFTLKGGNEFGRKRLEQLLNNASWFSSCCFLDNLSYQSVYHNFDFLIGAGVVNEITIGIGSLPETIDAFIASNQGRWIFGHISYDYKEVLNGISSPKQDPIGFPLLYLFVPLVVLLPGNNGIKMVVQDDSANTLDLRRVFETSTKADLIQLTDANPIPRLNKQEYTEIIEKLRAHILRGDCYEINFCQEFFADHAEIDPVQVYRNLVRNSPNPFSCYYRHGHAHLMCASPERYLTRRGMHLISQPIKGTTPRSLQDRVADEAAYALLLNSRKELSENVMIVDLVRNDLSKICTGGSVKVDELFGVYSFPQVHQMISTISGIQRSGVTFSEILQATFPMGSMTGAPKKRVMELIEKYEPSRRGLFSGAVGYITPDGDFDFNVVIRSILYNDKSKYLSYQAGSGITWYSDPAQEYDECIWKAAAIRKVLNAV